MPSFPTSYMHKLGKNFPSILFFYIDCRLTGLRTAHFIINPEGTHLKLSTIKLVSKLAS